jgi:prophage antirepressor-like protein
MIIRCAASSRTTAHLGTSRLILPLGLSESALRKATGQVPAAQKQILLNDAAGRMTGKTFPGQTKPKKGGARALTIVSESGLNRIISRSQAAIVEGTFAFKFVEWVFGEVLPSLRKHGAYVVTRQAKALVRAMPGFAEARASGKVVRRTFTDSMKDFVSDAVAQGSNNAKWYYRLATACINKLLFGVESVDRDKLSPMDQFRLAQAEGWLAAILDEERSKVQNCKTAFKRSQERLQAIYAAMPAASAASEGA